MKLIGMPILVIFFILYGLISNSKSYAQYKPQFWQNMQKKQEFKKTTRWTLTDWLDTKKRMNLMDQWLAMNTQPKDSFEFYIEGSKIHETRKHLLIQEDENYYQFKTGLSLWFLGLDYGNQRIKNNQREEELRASLRLLGSSSQSTYLKIFYGIRNIDDYLQDDLTHSFYGATVQAYLFSRVGGFAEFSQFSESESKTSIYKFNGQRMSYGAFIEINVIRIYAQWFVEDRKIEQNSVKTEHEHRGLSTGVQIYF